MDPRYTSKTGRWARMKEALKRREYILRAGPNLTVESESSSDDAEDYADVYEKSSPYMEIELPQDYWTVKKLSTYLKEGSPTLARLGLILISDCGFDNPLTLQALKDENCINLMINLLESSDNQVKLASLRCLQKLASQKMIRYEIVYFGGLEAMVGLLWEPNLIIRKHAAEAIGHLSVFHRAWKIVRNSSGIHLLANLMYIPGKILKKNPDKLSSLERDVIGSAVVAAKALCALCEDKKNKNIFWNTGALVLCEKNLKSSHTELLIAIMALLQQCAVKKYFRTGIRSSGMLFDVRRHLFSEHKGLMQASAQTVFRCAEDYHSRELFGAKGYLKRLCDILSSSENHTDTLLMASITGALWKCAMSPSNVQILHSVNAVQLLTQLLPCQPLQVQVHIVGCIGLCIKYRPCLVVARKNGCIDAMVALLQTTHPPLIKNLNKAIAEASTEPESMAVIDKLDAVRLVWSHLRNNDPSVVSNTAWKLHTILRNQTETAVYVRTLLGGLEIVVKPFSWPQTSVLTPICAVVTALSKETENVAMLTDFHIVRLLSQLTGTKCKRLRYFLCLAIAGCCPYKQNRVEFGERGVVVPILKFLKSKTPEVRGAACHAIYQMSLIPKWCVVIHRTKGVLNILFELMNSKDFTVQVKAASTVQNIRYFSLVRDNNIPDFLEERIIKMNEQY